MEIKCRMAFENLDPNEWFDLWHTHPDWDGKGNTKPENRIRSDELTYKMLLLAEEITNHRGENIQCFAILTTDSMYNSIYIHSENPNSSEFPFKYDGVLWGYSNLSIDNIVNLSTHEIGLIRTEDEETIFIRRRA